MTTISPHVSPVGATAPGPNYPMEADMPNAPRVINPPVDASREELQRWGYETLGDTVGTAREEDAVDEAA
jgi:hypothetical protein